MTCPNNVPTIPFYGCDSTQAIFTLDGWDNTSPTVIQCFGDEQIVGKGEATLVILFHDPFYVSEFVLWFKNQIAHGTKPFAVKTEYMGVVRWWVAKFKEPKFVISADGTWRKTSNKIKILGWARDVTDIQPSQYVVTDDGSQVVTDDGSEVVTDIQVGTATNIICEGV